MASGANSQGSTTVDNVGAGAHADNNPSGAREEKMKVVVRVRPLQAKEESWPTDIDVHGPDTSAQATITIQENEVMWEKNGQLKILKADAVFANGATQDRVYLSVAECVDALIAGFDCSVFAYGQTGTGKTFTMSGLQRDETTDNEALGPTPASHGVVPRSIKRLFAEIEREKRGVTGASFSVYCSFIEIYNEKIYDILSPEAPANGKGNQSPDSKTTAANNGSFTQRARWNSTVSGKEAKSLQIRQKIDGSVFVDGMTSRSVSNDAELLQTFREGSLHREVRDNFYNQFSSRGHAVFQITLRRSLANDESNKTNSKKTRLSRLFFVDLAGSEKWHVNGSDLTDKYASELSSINKSLSALTNCVMALTQKERSHVPFRDSVLTRLLQPCLQGSGRTAFIVTISPSKGSLEESFATLRFAERLKAIRCRPIRRSLFSNEMLGEQRLYYERQIQVMRAEVNRLRELLRKANQRPNEAAGSSSRDANAALVEENRRLKELLLQSERSRVVERNERVNSKSGKTSSGAIVRMSPQQFSARQMLKSTSVQGEDSTIGASSRNLRQDSQSNHSIEEPIERTTNRSNKASDQPRDQLLTLENQLQSKEARLNWMLEAEMEAQNAGTGAPVANDTAPTEPNQRPTVTRSWAVETRLRRQLVGIPPPLRETQSDPGTGSDKTPAPSRVDSATDQPTSQPTSRNPGRRQAPSPPTETHSQTDHASTGGRRSRADTFAKSHQAGRSESTASHAQPDQVKAASILKLVGSGVSAVSGKTREELIEEYKRARRAELEAMMRTMVQK